MTIMGLTCIVQRRCSDRQQTAQDRDEKRQEIHLWTHRGFWKDLTYLVGMGFTLMLPLGILKKHFQ